MTSTNTRSLRIGVVSDTHGLVRPEVLKELLGCERILHAGDVGGPEVLEALAEVAPVDAVRGNVDSAPWAAALPELLQVDIGNVPFHLLHRVHDLPFSPSAPAVVVSGHSHRPSIEWRDGVLFLNPGSIGPRRFSLPVSMALVCVADGEARAELVELDV